MTQHKPVLTDAEMHDLISGNLLPVGLSLDRLESFARNVEQAVLAKLTEQKPVVYRFLRPSTKQYVYITDNVPAIKEFEPLYAHPMPTDYFPDSGNMVTQRQEPVAWRITAKRFCGDFTKDRDIAQYWLEKEPESITPLYLAPTLPLEPSDELIAEIKAMADIRLVDGRVELSNVKEIIHAIVHHSIYAN